MYSIGTMGISHHKKWPSRYIFKILEGWGSWSVLEWH